ncbi:hypothetical protein C1I95_27140 [Micromonospora craterilacus]|uniref:Uncharacterized protein n=1 Tax=Micromonospora craterilacus TaxID=1655439 RepID=A0A2W2ED44_9ACTN|nr:hypothetical protein [Micromonospora craterilacus]PZG11530.1 hypothetical protein C1I95_27140 [Micromonospora craterilacus]
MSTHDCAEYIEVVHAQADKVNGGVWKHLHCTVCTQTFSFYDHDGSDTLYPIPATTDPGWQMP